jgi:excisionase family DNA binding protein
MEPLLLSTGQAAKRLGIGKTKLLSLVRTGRLPCKMFDGRIRIPLAAIEQFNDALPGGYVAGKAVRS